MRLDMVC